MDKGSFLAMKDLMVNAIRQQGQLARSTDREQATVLAARMINKVIKSVGK